MVIIPSHAHWLDRLCKSTLLVFMFYEPGISSSESITSLDHP